jgi:type II secretory pathway component PulF
VNILGPAALVVVVGMVGSIVLAILLPILNMNMIIN